MQNSVNEHLKKTLYTIAVLFMIISPILAGTVRGALTDTSILKYEAFFPRLNDEIGYYRAVKTMREVGIPKGVNDYMESQSRIPSYGAYNYVTYTPYYIMSFVTGIKSHNFIVYSNVLMLMIAYFLAFLMLKPSALSCIFMGLFTMSQLIFSANIWSGMSEMSTVSGTIVIFAIALYLFFVYDEDKGIDGKVWALLILQVLLISYLGLIRPYVWLYMLYPMAYLGYYRKCLKKAAYVWMLWSLLGVLLVGLFSFYTWMGKNMCATYWSSGSAMDALMEYLRAGDLSGVIAFVLNKNKPLLDTLMFRDYARYDDWASIVTVQTLVITLLLCVFMIAHRKDKKRILVGAVTIVAFAAIIEANLLFYDTVHLNRMLLTSMVGGAFILYYLDAGIFTKIINQVLVVLIMVIVFAGNIYWKDPLKLPQRLEDNRVFDEVSKNLAEGLPYDDGSLWNNTIATDQIWWDYWIHYCLPSYIGVQDFLDSKEIIERMEKGALKSKYVMISINDISAYGYLTENNCKCVYEDYAYMIFAVR